MFKAFTVNGYTGHINEILTEAPSEAGVRENIADLLDAAFADWDRSVDSPDILTEDIFIMCPKGEVEKIIC